MNEKTWLFESPVPSISRTGDSLFVFFFLDSSRSGVASWKLDFFPPPSFFDRKNSICSSLPSWQGLHIPPKGKAGKSSTHKCFGKGYVSFQEGN